MEVSKYSKAVVVNLRVEGLHHWPDAVIHEPLVGFLRYPHRHEFHIKAIAAVTHNERDIEIIRLKREIVDYLTRNFSNEHLSVIDFGPRSCETIAEDLADAFNLTLCEVLEDGENGAVVIRNEI